jgi:hypothetical protein
MQRGACEAVWLAKPIITSDWPVLRAHFHKGTVHVENTVGGIQTGIRQMRENLPQLEQEIVVLQQERQLEWNSKYQLLMQLIRGAIPLQGTESLHTTVAPRASLDI